MFRCQCHKSTACQLGREHMFTRKGIFSRNANFRRWNFTSQLYAFITLSKILWSDTHISRVYIRMRFHIQGIILPKFHINHEIVTGNRYRNLWVMKSSLDPVESLSCEINTFWWQSWDYTPNPFIIMSTIAFIAY